MKFDPRMEYYYNGEKLTPIRNSDNEIQYFVKQNLDKNIKRKSNEY